MKAVILAGGFGTRLSEETDRVPKPMVNIGGKPMLWHIMKIYSAHGINDFIICLGYKGYIIKEYFSNYFLHMSDVTVDVRSGKLEVHENSGEAWRITMVETGLGSMTGGRLKAVSRYLDEDDFCFTYGDGVSDIHIKDVIAFHKSHGKLATVTAITPPGRWGVLRLDGETVTGFTEKMNASAQSFINGGFFVLNKKVLDYIDSPQTIWEREPMERLAADGQLQAFCHSGYWQAMDTLREKNLLEELWESGNAPWRCW